MILPGSTSQALAAELARETGERLLQPTFRRFPDGELLAALDEASAAAVGGDGGGARVVVVGSTATSDAHVELLQLQDAAREAGASEVVTVIPYMGYARQDEAFKPGQPVSSRAVARAISTGADRVVLVNPHEPGLVDAFDVPCEAVDAAPRLADPLPQLADPLFLSPDEGAIELAATVRDAHDAGETDYFVKERDYDSGEVSVSPNDASVAGRDVVLVDDIVATGSTMSESIAVLRDRGAGRVFVTCVHPLLATSARTKLEGAGVEAVFGTDTLERDVSRVSVAPVVADAL